MQHNQKSRTRAQKQVRTPAARVITRYIDRKPKLATCATCGSKLKGVPHERPLKMQNMPKSSKRPERPYGGVLCGTCTRLKIKLAARQ